mmetsp:Transcript_16470/g.51239  ORF Transcript_16470/g.51239 Transcript_16470/m.51239 type:complete len:380 (+) Transcript_16470:875-2014(+)
MRPDARCAKSQAQLAEPESLAAATSLRLLPKPSQTARRLTSCVTSRRRAASARGRQSKAEVRISATAQNNSDDGAHDPCAPLRHVRRRVCAARAPPRRALGRATASIRANAAPHEHVRPVQARRGGQHQQRAGQDGGPGEGPVAGGRGPAEGPRDDPPVVRRGHGHPEAHAAPEGPGGPARGRVVPPRAACARKGRRRARARGALAQAAAGRRVVVVGRTGRGAVGLALEALRLDDGARVQDFRSAVDEGPVHRARADGQDGHEGQRHAVERRRDVVDGRVRADEGKSRDARDAGRGLGPAPVRRGHRRHGVSLQGARGRLVRRRRALQDEEAARGAERRGAAARRQIAAGDARRRGRRGRARQAEKGRGGGGVRRVVV